jgi:hypothetical protein
MTRLPLVAALALLAGCAGSLYTNSVHNSAQTPDQVFECMRNQLKSVGFTQTANDVDAHRLAARHINPDVRIASANFRRTIDVLEIDSRPASSGGSAVEIRARTFYEFATARGITQEETNASAAAKQAAQTLMQQCAP